MAGRFGLWKISLFICCLLAVLVCLGLWFSRRHKNPSLPDDGQMVLRHVLFRRIDTLDPACMTTISSKLVAGQIFEPLYTYHYLKRPYEIIPNLAEQMPQTDPDRLTYTIKIRRDVYFQNDNCFPAGKGRQLKAGDFVYAAKRIANAKCPSFRWSSLQGRITGLDDFRRYTQQCQKPSDVDYNRNVEGLKALDDYTLQIKLTRPWPQMVESVLCDISTAPIAHETVEFYGPRISDNPVGTGPYKLGRWKRGSYVELVKNENWRGELYPDQGQEGDAQAGLLDNAGSAIPFADKVIWTVVEEPSTAWLLFMQGRIDAMSIPKDNFSDVVGPGLELKDSMRQKGIELHVFDDAGTFYIGFNMKDPVVGTNKPLRAAISMAIDRRKFVELFTNGHDRIAGGFIPPLLDSHDPANREDFCVYDPAMSAQLLKQARQLSGGKIPRLHLAMPSANTFTRQYGQFISQQLAQIGLELEVDYMDQPRFTGRLNSGQTQLFAGQLIAAMPDAIDILKAFASSEFPPGANKCFYSNPQFDTLYQQAQLMPDDNQRKALYRQMEQIVLADYPAVFINHRVAYTVSHSWYRNVKPHLFSYGLSKYIRIDNQKRILLQNNRHNNDTAAGKGTKQDGSGR